MDGKPNASYHILRVGMGITFIWIGVLIFRDPQTWAAFINPWVRELIPIDPVQTILGTAVFDIILGFMMLINLLPWVVALLATVHLVGILIVSGINEITVRDIGLATGTIALFWQSLPERHKTMLKHKAKTS